MLVTINLTGVQIDHIPAQLQNVIELWSFWRHFAAYSCKCGITLSRYLRLHPWIVSSARARFPNLFLNNLGIAVGLYPSVPQSTHRDFPVFGMLWSSIFRIFTHLVILHKYNIDFRRFHYLQINLLSNLDVKHVKNTSKLRNIASIWPVLCSFYWKTTTCTTDPITFDQHIQLSWNFEDETYNKRLSDPNKKLWITSMERKLWIVKCGTFLDTQQVQRFLFVGKLDSARCIMEVIPFICSILYSIHWAFAYLTYSPPWIQFLILV